MKIFVVKTFILPYLTFVVYDYFYLIWLNNIDNICILIFNYIIYLNYNFKYL